VVADGNRLTIDVSDPEAYNPVLIRELIRAGAAVQYVIDQEHSLEDVYLSLVDEGAE
jgi:ABC-2 type transport system ATP-binding protein